MTCPHCHAALGVDARFCPVCGRALSSTETQAEASGAMGANLIGREIAGRFRILAKIGEGGMGAVYRGEQMSLKRAVAVKVLRPELSANKMILRRFSAEAEAVAKLDHPNTVKVYDFGQDTDGALFIAMEHVEGGSLRKAMTGGPMSPARALAIAIQVAASLTDAHAQSIIHRDLKPDNVMLQDKGRARDIVRVLDFGIAKLRDDQRSTQQAMTQAGDMLGTPQYMAPEQIRGEGIDGRTDVYALGCMLYEMITGRLPFEATSVLAILTKHLTDVVIPPSQRRPDLALPTVIDQVVMTAMAKEPAARPATMERYGELLAGALQAIDPTRQMSAAMPAMTPMSVPMVAMTPQPIVSHAPTPIPPTVRSPGGYRPGAAAPAAYTPPPPYRPPVLAHPPQRNWMPLFILLGVVGIAGAGIGVYFATKKPAPTDTNRAGDTTITPNPTDPPKSDPWGTNSSSASPPPPRSDVDVGTALTPIPDGAHVNVPEGFVKLASTPQGQAYSDPSSGALIALAPLIAGTNDANELAADWVKNNIASGVTLRNITEMPTITGKKRPLMLFTGTYNGKPVMQMIVLYIEPAYRLGFLIQMPTTATASKQKLLQQLLMNGVALP